MTVNELINELSMLPDKDRKVRICKQIGGETVEIVEPTEIHGGRENDNVYICFEEEEF